MAHLPPAVQTPSIHRHATDYRVLLAKNAGCRLPLPWLQPRPPLKNRVHLPLDAIPYSLLFLVGPEGLAPLPVISKHLLVESYPDPPERRLYPQLTLRCRHLLFKELEALAPDLVSYPYHPSLKSYPFIGLNKFDAGRLPQIRSGKIYLRADPTWDNHDPTTCQRCKEFLEAFENSILSCPTKEPARARLLRAVSALGPEAPVLCSAALLAALSRFIKSTRTGFPLGMFSRPTSAASSASLRAANVVSFVYFMSSQEN